MAEDEWLRRLTEREIALLRQCWDEGKASGIAGHLDIERIVREGHAKLRGDRFGRQVLAIEEISEADIAEIAKMRVPPEYDHLNKLLDDEPD